MTNEQEALILSVYERHDDLVRQYNNLKSKFFVFQRGNKLKELDAEFDKIDAELVSAVVSSCKTIQLLPIQKHGFDILNAAFEKSKSYISILPDDDKVDDDLVSMKDVSSTDTDERKEWFKSYMEIFPRLSHALGWRLTAMTRRRYCGGSAEFFVTNDDGEFCKNPLDRISGMGLSSLYGVWEKEKFAEPSIIESYEPDRTKVIVEFEADESELGEKKHEVREKISEVREKRLGSEDANSDFEVLMGAYRNDFRENARKILSAIAGDQEIDTTGLTQKLRISEASVWRAIRAMNEVGLLVREGGDKGGKWIVKK